MRIDCPFCGPRDHQEFTYGGDASVARPPLEDGDMDRWFEYVFLRHNPRGSHLEYWQHRDGCRQWLRVERDTLSHQVRSVRAAEALHVSGDALEADVA
jgi:sarcosine oxidase subunit delta